MRSSPGSAGSTLSIPGACCTTRARCGARSATRSSRSPRGGLFDVALYNDQGWISRYWHAVKRLHHRGGAARALMVAVHAPYLIGLRAVVRAATGRGRIERGMTYWHDMQDWLGGLPFEVARPEAVRAFAAANGLVPVAERLCGRRSGCNEFVFRRPPG